MRAPTGRCSLALRRRRGWASAGLLLVGLSLPAVGQRLSARVADSLQADLIARAISLPPRLSALDSANGLGSFRLGAPVVELPEPLAGLQVLKHDRLQFYAPTAVVNIEGLVLPGFTLLAYGGRLSRITFGPTSEYYAANLLDRMQARFGPGRHTGYKRYEWRGQVVTLVYELLVLPRERSGGLPVRGTAYLQSNALAAQERAEAKARRKP